MPFATIDELRQSLLDPHGGLPEEYREKQIHPLPDFPVVKRVDTILMLARGEVVLDIGGSGPLHEKIAAEASGVFTWDREPVEGPGAQIDLDEVGLELPQHDGVTLVICGETLEHLANPGHFLDRLKAAYPVPKVFTVPNAHSLSGLHWIQRGVENVNRDHVSWYSWRTLKTLLEDRCGYEVTSWNWYNGQPGTSEGLLVVTD